MHAGGGFLGHAFPFLDDLVPEPGPFLVNAFEQVLDHLFLVIGALGVDPIAAVLQLVALVDQQRRVAPVVHYQLRAEIVAVGQRVQCAFPVFLEGLAFPGEHRHAGLGDSGGGMVLGRENIAAGPTDRGPELDQGLDQDRRLDCHVQRPGNPHSGQRFGRAVFLADRHQPGHLVLGYLDRFAAGLGQRDVADLVIGGAVGCRRNVGGQGVSGCHDQS